MGFSSFEVWFSGARDFVVRRRQCGDFLFLWGLFLCLRHEVKGFPPVVSGASRSAEEVLQCATRTKILHVNVHVDTLKVT